MSRHDPPGRPSVGELAAAALEQGDATGWFEAVYRGAGSAGEVPWADLAPNPGLVSWLAARGARGGGRPALTVGAGLGDDAEALARAGYSVIAFDIAPTAVAWARRRFPDSPVDYRVADVLAPPPEWNDAFELVVEARTLQSLPADVRRIAAERMAALLAPGGTLLVLAAGRDEAEDPGSRPPWPLSPGEVRALFAGLDEVRLEDDPGGPDGLRRLRVELRRARVQA